MVNVTKDPAESCNRTITVYGKGGSVPRGGSPEQPIELFIGNAGTAARFLAALVCLGEGHYHLHGVPRMHERPQAALFHALRQLGYMIDSGNDRLPVLITGGGPKPGATCQVSVDESSQFASALLLAGDAGGWNVEIRGGDREELPYVEMTRELVKIFPRRGGRFQIEPDASSGSYFWAARWLLAPQLKSEVSVSNWPTSGWQLDARFTECVRADSLPAVISRSRDLADSIMTAIVLAPLSGSGPVKFTDLGRLRVQECERVVALRTELTKCGARVVEQGDALEIFPSPLYGATVETYNDHRMAMCFAILGLKVPGIKIKNPACVKKTFPNFFQKLAAMPPHGLGARILDDAGRPLSHEELFAE
jgi:3-phosphoshikimate 1-carboxyvinyltransferase